MLIFQGRLLWAEPRGHVQVVVGDVAGRNREIVFDFGADQNLEVGGVARQSLAETALLEVATELPQGFEVGDILGCGERRPRRHAAKLENPA